MRGDSEFPGVQPADEPSNFAEGEAKEVGPMLAHLASRLDDLRAAPEHWPIKVRLQDGTEKEVHAEDFDVEFIREWGKLVGTPKSEFTFECVGLVFPFTLDAGTFQTRRAALTTAEKNVFSLVWAGERLGMESDVGKSKKLGEWMKALDSLRNNPAMQKGSPEGSTSVKGSQKTASSVRKDGRDWSLFFTPSLVSSPASEMTILNAALPSAGSPEPLEWWHHDNRTMDGKDWGSLAVDIGYSSEVVRGDDKPSATIANGMCQRALGFPAKRVEWKRDISKTPPENGSKIPEGG